jgi:hypothetical protein
MPRLNIKHESVWLTHPTKNNYITSRKNKINNTKCYYTNGYCDYYTSYTYIAEIRYGTSRHHPHEHRHEEKETLTSEIHIFPIKEHLAEQVCDRNLVNKNLFW